MVQKRFLRERRDNNPLWWSICAVLAVMIAVSIPLILEDPEESSPAATQMAEHRPPLQW